MTMDFQGTYSLPAVPDTIWSLLTDPAVLKQIIPGCEWIEADGSLAYRLAVRQRFGQTSGVFDGTLRFSEPGPDGSTVTAEASGSLGGILVTGVVCFVADSPWETTLAYNGTVDFQGGLTIYSPRLLQTTARSFLRRATHALAQQVALATGGPMPGEEAYCPVPNFDEDEATPEPARAGRIAPAVLGFALLFLALFLATRRRAHGVSDVTADEAVAAAEEALARLTETTDRVPDA